MKHTSQSDIAHWFIVGVNYATVTHAGAGQAPTPTQVPGASVDLLISDLTRILSPMRQVVPSFTRLSQWKHMMKFMVMSQTDVSTLFKLAPLWACLCFFIVACAPQIENKSTPVQLTSGSGVCAINEIPTWMPDGKLLFSRGCAGLMVSDLDGQGLRKIPNTQDGDGIGCLSVSHDNTRILFDSIREGQPVPHIFVINTDGTNLAQLTNSGEGDYCPKWSPDGTRIAFSSDRNGASELYVMDVTGGNLVQLTFPPISSIALEWEPNGERLAFVDQTKHQIYTIRSTGGSPVAVTTNNWFILSSLAWSPNGRWIVFYSDADIEGENPAGLYAIQPDGTGRVLLFAGLNARRPAFSPQGDAIAFAWQRKIGETGETDIYILKSEELSR